MTDAANTALLRLEGPLQAWGDNSKFVIRRTMEAPTKSGVLGLICCAMGLSRRAARARLPRLAALAMGVRVDRPGARWWDFHTAGAGIGLMSAQGKLKETATIHRPETLITRREYLCDASFVVALHGEPETIAQVCAALLDPVWPVYLGRKACPPSTPVYLGEARCGSLLEALASQPWRPRYKEDAPRGETQVSLPCILEWRPSEHEPVAPDEAEVWYDRPVSFDPPVHEARLVIRRPVTVPVSDPALSRTPAPVRPRANYQNTEFRKARAERLDTDEGLCVFCKAPATTVQHVTYRRAGGDEQQADLRSLCRLCHDAVTMIEYGLGMGIDRINPEDPQWRQRIIDKRDEIIAFRSMETRRRYLAAEDVE